MSQYNFEARSGETFQPVLRWGTDTLISKTITGISQAAPVVVTAAGHAIPDGWSVAVVSSKGCTGLNAVNFQPRGRDWHAATVLSSSTVQLNEVNSADLPAYTSGGFLVYSTPVDLSAITAAVMTIRDVPGTGTVLKTLAIGTGITLDNTLKTITPSFATAALTWTLGYYDLELTDSAGKITQLLDGTISIL
jgi:hypothetical protein